MVAEILAGIALAKTAVSGIKSVIDTAKDVNDVAHFVDDLFKGYDQSRHAARKAQEKAKKGDKLQFDTPLSPQAIYHILEKRSKEAGVLTKYAPHDLRRTLISTLLSNEVDMALVSRIVGHSSVTMTARYDVRKEEEMRRATNKIYTPYLE